MRVCRRNRLARDVAGCFALLMGSASAPLCSASAPSQASPPSSQAPALRIDSAGLDAILADSRDAGLRRALSMLDDRLLELPAEFGGPPIPPGSLEFLFEVLSSPCSLSVDVVDGGDWAEAPPIRAQLTVRPGTLEDVGALVTRFEELFSMLVPVPAAPVAGQPALKSVELPNGRIIYGSANEGGSFLVSYGEPTPSGPKLGSPGLPRGVEPVFALELNADKLREPLEHLLAEDAEAGKARAVFEWWGFLGEDPLGFTLALGHAADRAHVAMRYRNWRKVAARQGSLASGPLSKAELRMVPADAIMAALQRIDPRAVLHLVEMLGQEEEDLRVEIESTLGIELEADVFEPLGETVAFYMSDTTGGGGLASMVAFLAVEDPTRAALSIEKTVSAINDLAQSAASGRVRLRAWDHQGAACHSLAFPGLPIPIEPSLALSGGYLFFAATPQALAAAVDHARGSAPGLLAHPAIKNLAAGSLDDLQAISFSDTPRLLNDGYGLAGLFASALANGVRSPSDPSREPGLVLPLYHDLLASAQPSILLSRIQGDDLVVVGDCDRSVMANATAMLGGPMSLLFGAGLAASAFVPSVVKELSVSQESRAMADIVIIEEAISRYAIEHGGKYPDSLERLVTPDENGHTYLDLEEVPLDPWGNPYQYEPPGEHRSTPRVFTLGSDGLRDADIEDFEWAPVNTGT